MTAAARRSLRLVGAVALLLSGAVHVQLLLEDYGTDDIAVAFAGHAAAAALLGGYLALRADRAGPVAGVLFALGSLLALAMARTGDGLLGLRESGLDPSPQTVLSVVTELVAVLALAPLLLPDGSERVSPERLRG